MKFLFVCIGNSCRSQIAEAVTKNLGYEAQSAGTNPAKCIHENAIISLNKRGINTKGLYPKHLDDINITDEIIVSMGCGVKCPNIRIDYDFNLNDPKHEDLDYFIELVSIIENKIIQLIKEKQSI